MSEFMIERYSAADREAWDAFVRASRNGTFLFERGYMDYHSDRFADCSWIARKGNAIAALLPANLTPDGVLHSHQGLSYGGWVLPPAHLDGADLLEIFRLAVDVWGDEGYTELDYKPIPSVYHRRPSEEDEYALWRLGAQITQCGLDAAIDLRGEVRFNSLRRRNLRRTSLLPLEIKETDDTEAFIAMLAACLGERHGVRPVHTAAELALLRERFPSRIRIFAATLADSPDPMDAGVCVYDTGSVAHAQYIATTRRGREANLLTPLFHRLITETFASRSYFDFGISTEEGGRLLNAGLLRQKYSFGATGVVTRRYSLPLRVSKESETPS